MKTTVGVLFFLGAMALAGGIEMIAFPLGGPFLAAAWLERIPVVDSYVVPGLVLTVVFGLGIPIAVGDAEQVTTRVTNSLACGVLGAVAVALLVLPQTPGVRRHLGRDDPGESTDARAPTS